MPREDKPVLDGIEGLGHGYDEINLEVPGFGGCFSYIARDAFLDDTLRPYDWYKAFVLAGANLHRFPDEYIRRIEATSAIADPDPQRGAGQWALADKMITTHC